MGGVQRGGVAGLDSFGYELALLRAVAALWDSAARMDLDDPPARVGVVLEHLCDPSGPTLFEGDPREHRLQWMLDRVRARYGARALLWAPIRAVGTLAPRLPTRVSRIWLGCGGLVSWEATRSSVGRHQVRAMSSRPWPSIAVV